MLFDKITPNEQTAIINYIEENVEARGLEHRRGGLEDILAPWEKAKTVFLDKLFGNRLIYSETIRMQRSNAILEESLRDLVKHSPFIEWLDAACSMYRSDIFDLKTESRFIVRDLFSLITLKENKYYGRRETIVFTNPDFKNIQVQKYCSPMKILKQIADNFGFEQEFEQFRLDHSRILNQKEFEGELCISIHPLDYMTMSDNNNDWTSCMNWRHSGGYRRGTVEMMNSPYVVVAYLMSKKPMILDYETSFYWNSKRWRELFIITEDIITNVKGYPYRSEELTTTVLKILKRLAEENLGFKYKEECISFECEGEETYDLEDDISFSFETETMYNDFDSTEHHAYIGEDAFGHNTIYYSGPESCLWCGEVGNSFTHGAGDFESNLICNDCFDGVECDICDRAVSEDEISFVDGVKICSCCYEHEVIETVDDESAHLYENCHKVYLTPDPDTPPRGLFNYGYFIWVYDLGDKEFFEKYFTSPLRTILSSAGREVKYFALSDCSQEALEDLFNISTNLDLNIFKESF